MYNYYWGYTAQQIQLLIADAPIVVYKKDKKKSDKKPSILSRLQGERKFIDKYADGDSKNKFDFSRLKGIRKGE